MTSGDISHLQVELTFVIDLACVYLFLCFSRVQFPREMRKELLTFWKAEDSGFQVVDFEPATSS